MILRFVFSNKCHIRRVVVLALVLVAGWMLLSYKYRPHLKPLWFRDLERHRSEWPRQKFIEASIHTTTEDDFDYSHIRAVCDASPWDENLVFRCENVEGGIGEI